jgi:hypothetical protein
MHCLYEGKILDLLLGVKEVKLINGSFTRNMTRPQVPCVTQKGPKSWICGIG